VLDIAVEQVDSALNQRRPRFRPSLSIRPSYSAFSLSPSVGGRDIVAELARFARTRCQPAPAVG
jgi:hypothetical protein